MRTRLVIAVVAFGVLRCACVAQTDPQDFPQIERGRYLATVGDCIACHTAPGGKPFAGGLPIETPFGTLVSANITPDRETGIGAWSAEQFARAMHEGIGADGRPLYPAFPYTSFTKVSRRDIDDIRAYLASLEPVRNAVVSNVLPFPFNIRNSMVIWNSLNFTRGEFQRDPGQTDQWNRGAYLVLGLGHCDTCHTPRNFMGGEKSAEAFRGAIVQGWLAPELSGARSGLANWSADEVVEYLATGHNRSAAATGPMADVVSYSTSKMTREDLAAMAVYLKSLTGSATAAIASPPAAQMTDGKAIFDASCAACHQKSGEGVPKLYPALAKAPSLQAIDATDTIRVVLQGTLGVVTDAAPTGATMPSYGWKLSDAQIAAVTTYVRSSWGNSAPTVAADDVAAARKKLSAAN